MTVPSGSQRVAIPTELSRPTSQTRQNFYYGLATGKGFVTQMTYEAKQIFQAWTKIEEDTE